MTQTYEIVIQNDAAQAASFMVFQQQPLFTNAGVQPTLMSNSLGCGYLATYVGSGSKLKFPFDSQIYASAQTNQLAPQNQKAVQQPVEFSAQPVALATASNTGLPTNNTTLSLSPFGLSQPVNDPSVPLGNFGISVPSYTQTAAIDLVCGVAVEQASKGRILSCYVNPPPANRLYCAPLPIFYVSLGEQDAGNPIQYDISNAACCDFTQGYGRVNATYNANGTFTASGG